MADTILIDDFSDTTGPWRFFTDQVMGGVSTGEGRVATEGGVRFLRLTGTVSTKNRGGFIQARRDLDAPLPEDASALRIRVRGDGETYFIHLRTRATALPWQYYQVAFRAARNWQEITLPFTAFKPSGRLLPGTPRPERVTSVALVAYGRDHEPDVSLARVEAV
ncbi:CIA30 family protein [Roseovarius aestuariivivens]|uniref:CIA30 family protein n=1 Tax=Roseovarius aestuariivivens TaxID=1888910 RepID=UPI001081C03F|nr:CIA30 family protein [Roseovarius aestuariivivens]